MIDRDKFDKWQDDFIKEMAVNFGVPEHILRSDPSWTDPKKEEVMSEKKEPYVEFAEAIIKGFSDIHDTMIRELDEFKNKNRRVCIEPPSELIQGYTEEQWQEIIDGGYVVEIGDRDGFDGGLILNLLDKDDLPLIIDGRMRCRPAKLKGVIRPIFVGPDDNGVICNFWGELGEWCCSGPWSKIGGKNRYTKYMEV